jgi:hypothetical protein
MMTPGEYLNQIRELSNKNVELTWFSAEVAYYAAAGRTLDSLKDHLRLGCGIDKDEILIELGSLLKSIVDLFSCTMSHLVFVNHNWISSREMVPAGVNGCANSILNMIRSGDAERRIHFFANACSHLGFSFDVIAEQSITTLKKASTKQE